MNYILLAFKTGDISVILLWCLKLVAQNEILGTLVQSFVRRFHCGDATTFILDAWLGVSSEHEHKWTVAKPMLVYLRNSVCENFMQEILHSTWISLKTSG